MSILLQFWNVVSNIGVSDTINDRLRRKIILTNQLVFTAIFMSFGMALQRYFLPKFIVICIASSFAYSITFFFNRLKMYDLARIYFIVVSNLAVVISGCLVTSSEIYTAKFMLLALVVLAFVLFELYEVKYLVTSVIITVGLFISVDFLNSVIPLLDGINPTLFDNKSEERIIGIFSFVIIGAGFFYLQRLNIRSESKLRNSLELSDRQRIVIQNKVKDLNRALATSAAQKKIIEQKNRDLTRSLSTADEQKRIIEEKSVNINASISYAEQIQLAILPTIKYLKTKIPNIFVIYKPRDVVSGDFYWFSQKNDKYIIAAVDCTGHGVPGALMSMIGNDLLNQIVNVSGITESDEILNQLHFGIQKNLNQKYSKNTDGMDVALCVIDIKKQKLQFSGAINPLYYIEKNELHELKGDRQTVGGYGEERKIKFTRQEIDIDELMHFYIFSDGIQDQFGGEKEKKFRTTKLKEFLLKNHKKDFEKQKENLEKTISEWQGDIPQVDDILLIGFKVEGIPLTAIRGKKKVLSVSS